MNLATSILITIAALLCGCRNYVPGLPLPHGTHLETASEDLPISPTHVSKLGLQRTLQGQAQSGVVLEPQWPWVTNTIAFSGMDTNCDYSNEWTNNWTCDALVTMDISQPKSNWHRIINVPIIQNYQGLIAFQIITNTPWLNIAAEYSPK